MLEYSYEKRYASRVPGAGDLFRKKGIGYYRRNLSGTGKRISRAIAFRTLAVRVTNVKS
jgi:hypothetical protein